MKNFAKKLSALLLTLAMVLTMMPMIAAPAFAEGDEASGTAVYTVSLNGEKICDLTAEWMEDNSYEPQIFPNITKKGINYVVAQGPAIDDVLCYGLMRTRCKRKQRCKNWRIPRRSGLCRERRGMGIHRQNRKSSYSI